MGYSKDYKTKTRVTEAEVNSVVTEKEQQKPLKKKPILKANIYGEFFMRHRSLKWLGYAVVISLAVMIASAFVMALMPEELESPSLFFFVLFALASYISTFGGLAFFILCIVYYFKDREDE